MALFDRLTEFNGPVYRNITSLRVSQDLFDDLVDDGPGRAAALAADLRMRSAATGIIERGLLYSQAIDYPFASDSTVASRYGDGRLRVWYGALEEATALAETCWHALRQLQGIEGGDATVVIRYRAVYEVHARGLFLELRDHVEAALQWLDDHGDLDGDGLIEYFKRADGGLDNQGWKDSWDGVCDERQGPVCRRRHPEQVADGPLGRGPRWASDRLGERPGSVKQQAGLLRNLARVRHREMDGDRGPAEAIEGSGGRVAGGTAGTGVGRRASRARGDGPAGAPELAQLLGDGGAQERDDVVDLELGREAGGAAVAATALGAGDRADVDGAVGGAQRGLAPVRTLAHDRRDLGPLDRAQVVDDPLGVALLGAGVLGHHDRLAIVAVMIVGDRLVDGQVRMRRPARDAAFELRRKIDHAHAAERLQNRVDRAGVNVRHMSPPLATVKHGMA